MNQGNQEMMDAASRILEAEEHRGQVSLSRGLLPKKLSEFSFLQEAGQQKLAQWGFEWLGPANDPYGLFDLWRWPEGWQLRPDPHHPLHSDVVDERGNVRFSIFYKASRHDPAAHIYGLAD